MVTYIRSDLEFILAQIKIAEDHALFVSSNGTQGRPLYGPNGSIPAYNIAWGLRTVDGSYNHLLPGHEHWGAADFPFPEILPPEYRPAQGGMLDPDGPGPAPAFPTQPNYNPSNNPNSVVVDPNLRTISNLIVDQTLDNPAAIMVALQRAGSASGAELQTAMQIKAEYAIVKPFIEAAESAELDNVNALRTLESAQQAFNESPTPENQAALDNAIAAQGQTQTAFNAATAALTTARVNLDALLTANGIELDGDNISLTNIAPDEGLSASFNSWFTLFGQFFDHGLDLVAKGNSGTVFIPLQQDDPLYDPTSPTNFMVLTRATVGPGTDGVMGTADDARPLNSTTSFVDQNQTYTSHPSHQVFLREYALVNGRPQATGNLLDGANGGLPTWGEVKAQAREMLGIDLTDYHVGNLPLLATDSYGNFIPHPVTGFAQVVMAGPPQTLASGTPAAPLSLVRIDPDGGDPDSFPDVVHLAVRTGHAFLDDIAHTAVPVGKIADGDIEVGLGNPQNGSTEYDNELLDSHFVTGDGRGNENIGLTAVHHVFHAEHNRLLQHTKDTVINDARALLDGGSSQAEAVAFLNEWLDVDVASVPMDATAVAALDWDGERLFQAAKFGTEMQYQHLVFEEFARKIQPNINVFLVPDGFDATLDPTIVAEFAHVVYRFGHSMLTETIDRFDPGFGDESIGLIEGFLNPIEFASQGSEEMAGSIIRGMTRQAGNEIDEFVTSALRNNLLGLPLDLATINLARGRDTGVPSLNEARRSFYEAAHNDTFLKPYESWVDLAANLKNEASIINFVAAYGTHALITSQTSLAGKRDAALTLITGTSFGGLVVPADAVDFLNATGAYAGGSLGGLENIDLWIGGLAEKTMPFGGMLGSTFNFVFEGMMEKLQSGDRFYYLQRLDGLHLFGEMENNSFAAMIMRNTDATHLPSDVFSAPGLILEVDQTKQFNDLNGDGILESTDPTGGGLLTQVVSRNNPATPGADSNYLKYLGGEHVVLGGTNGNDTLIASVGDDTLYGDGGNDNLEGGFGNDIINAGDGDDIIRDMGGDDNIKAGAGNDVVHAGPGLDLVMGNDGQDFIFLGTDMGSEVFAGTGNDFIYGNKNAERILGNEGNDWIETGTFDGAPGDNFDEVFAHDGIDGHDVFLGDGGFDEYIGEGGDDIMVGSAGRGKMVGMSGFDWATYKDNIMGVNANLSVPIVFDEAPTLPQNAALDEYESMEGLSGSRFNDVLTGTEDIAADRAPLSQGGTTGYRGSVLSAEGIALIAGLQEVLGAGVTSFDGGDIILAGDGTDVLQGLAGDDIIDGDKWLDVQIGVFATNDPDHTGTPIALHNSMTTLATQMFSGAINPGQLSIVRTIRNSTEQELSGATTDSDGVADVDRVLFSGARAEYDINFNSDGTIVVAHTGGLATDGTDTLRNVEVLDFTDQDISLLAPTLDLNGDTTNTTTVSAPQAYRDEFGSAAHNNTNGTVSWASRPWAESGDILTGNVVTGGQIQTDAGGGAGSNELRFLAGDGATITRSLDLAGRTTANVTFTYDMTDLEAGKNLVVEAFNLSTSTWQSLGSLLGSNIGGGNNANGTFSAALTPAQIGAGSAIRLTAVGNWDAGDSLFVDNFNVATTTTTTTTVPGTPGNNYETTYTENGAGVAIASGAVITDNGPTLASARVVITNASAGDVLSVQGGLPGGITAQIGQIANGQLVLTLTGTSSIANYRTALQQVRYSSTSNNPDPADRILQVTVNDGLLNSNVATATVNVLSVNDQPDAIADTVVSNVANNTAFVIPTWVLLANDLDADGNPLGITSVGNLNNLTSAVLGGGQITVTDGNTIDGSFQYTVNDGSGAANATDTATVTVDRSTNTAFNGGNEANIYVLGATADTVNSGGGNDFVSSGGGVDAINAGAGNDWVDAGDGNDGVTGGLGDDRIVAGTGNDTITWNANANGETDGFDIIDGGLGATDTFQLNGRANTAETFRIYARAEAVAAGISVVNADTEIVITRTVGGTTSVIAELDNIEEIRVNTQQVTSPGGTPPGGTGANSGDTIQVIGNFNAPFTSLNFNTITIDGNTGDDTVDISSLASAHRIVFRSNGGNDTIVGTLRPQDIIELPDGMTIADYEVTIDEESGQVELVGDEHTISFTASDGMPRFSSDDDWMSEDDEDEDEDEDDHGCDDDNDDQAPPVDNDNGPPAAPRALIGTTAADVLLGAAENDTLMGGGAGDILAGEEGDDILRGEDGDDLMTGGNGFDTMSGGAGNDELHGGWGDDLLFGNDGADMVHGDGGDDVIETGAGDDRAWGGGGDDEVLATAADGNDQYWGDEGSDTLNYAVATGNLSVDLGNGFMGRGQVTGNGGTDMFYGFENFIGGSGHDTVTATNAVNILDGGLGNDTFRFQSATAAHGDTIYGFAPGDKIDFSAIDANTTTAGTQSFTLKAGSALTAAGQVAVSYDVRDGAEVTLVRGNVDGDADAEFELTLVGRHNLTTNDFNGVS